MELHYNDIVTTEDKIIHILFAAKSENILGSIIIELLDYYDSKTIKYCIKNCKKKYPYIFNN